MATKEKEDLSKQIEEDIKEFVTKGGTIDQVPYGKSGEEDLTGKERLKRLK